MASRVRFAAIGLGALLSTAVIWSGCDNEARKVEEEEAGELRDLRSTLKLEIQSVNMPEGGAPTITFRATDQDDAPIDDFVDQAWEGTRPLNTTATPPEQRTPPYLAAPRFTIAMLEDDGDYVDYFVRTATAVPFIETQGGDPVDPAIPSTIQANFDAPPAAPAGGDVAAAETAFRARFQSQGDGVYVYTVSDLDPEIVAQMDRTKTHTAAMWTTRTTPDRDATRPSPASATHNFVPAGGGSAMLDEVVVDAACNTCHGVMSAHDNRTGVQVCITCHNPEAPDPAGGARAANVDPETNNAIDFKQMIHKIHAGSVLPSVQGPNPTDPADGTPYHIVGRATANPAPPSSVHDWSEVAFPQPVQNCTACHQGEDAANYKNRPAVAACSSCHDNVEFDGTKVAGLPGCAVEETTARCAHVGLPALDLTNCSACHSPDVIDAQHLVAGVAEAAQYRYEIVSAGIQEDRRPVVTFRVVNPSNGIAYDLRTHPTWTQTASGASRLFVSLGFPSNEYTNDVEGGQPFGQPLQIPIVDRPGVNAALENAEDGAYRIVGPLALPPGVTSATAMVEGHPAVAGGPTAGTRIPVTTAVEFFGVDGPAQPRRDVVSVESCNACHGVISAHGSNRNNTVQGCAVCHNPNATDRSRVPAGVEGETPIDFKWMVHVIHAGEHREAPVTIYGFGGTPHEFPAPVPFSAGNCNMCHVNDSFRVPLQEGTLGTTISSGEDDGTPSDNVRETPTFSACLSCHEGRTNERLAMTARDHALTYVNADGSEECATCHGTGGIVDVTQVHPIRARSGDEGENQ
jgi:OmcA/MtrC family decaheme c-type cytochrome